MAEGGEDYYSSSDDDSDDSLFDLHNDDDGADCGSTLCCCRKRFQRPMQALLSCHLSLQSLFLSVGFLGPFQRRSTHVPNQTQHGSTLERPWSDGWSRRRTCVGLGKVTVTNFRWGNMRSEFTKAQFRRRTFHEPNLIPWIKYMKSSASESVENGYLNLERLSRSFRLAQPGISPLERLWFSRRTFNVPNLMHKLL